MKRKILGLMTIALIAGTVSFAQGVGIKGGANITKIEGKGFNEEFKSGYSLGGFAEVYFNKKWGIQPEVLWNQYQTRTSADFDDVIPNGTNELKDVKLNYLSIPLLLNFRPASFITFQAGPQFGILINKNNGLIENGKQAFSKGDLSMLGGVQLNLGGLRVGGRYQVGLSNINDIDNSNKWTNTGFQIYAGIKLL
ncbi:MAG: PorT family protein [Chitinophagaceae bacterium]|nr:MAG: PorT family protein [Chitinophagaceae bacterium]